MKTLRLALNCAAILWVSPVSAQILISQFSFEIVTPGDSSGTGIAGPFNADFGPGTMSAFHASSSSFSTPVGNGSANAFSASNWNIGDYFQFSLSTVGFDHLFLTFGLGRSGTGPTTFQLNYSVDGGANFSPFGSPIAVSSTSFSASTYNSAFVSTFDLSAVSVLDNNPNAVFRLVATVAGTASAGTVRIDDFILSSGGPISVPEPGSVVWLAGAAAAGACLRILRRP